MFAYIGGTEVDLKNVWQLQSSAAVTDRLDVIQLWALCWTGICLAVDFVMAAKALQCSEGG